MNLPRWFYTLGWLLWGAVGLALEAVALRDRDKGDTLSEHVRRGLRLHPLIWWMAAGAMIWAMMHFLGFDRFGRGAAPSVAAG